MTPLDGASASAVSSPSSIISSTLASNTNTSSISNTRNSLIRSHPIDLPPHHNPYIGFFHGTLILRSLYKNYLYLPTSNPHVGILRHAPSNIISQSTKEKSISDSVTSLDISQFKIDRKKVMKDLDANIPRSQFSSRNSRFGDQPTCMICLDPIIDGDEIRNLKCSHCFHSKCVDIWLLGTLSDESLNTSICPTCRQEAISDHISVDSSVDSPSQLCSQDSTNSQTILAPKPIYLPPQSTAPSSKAVSEISSNSSYDTGSNVGFRPQDSDIPREVFMRVGQYLLDEEQINDTPSPLMSPAPARSPDVLSNFSYSSPIRPSIPQGIIEDQVLSRSSSFSSVSSSHSSSSSFLSVQNSNHSESGVYINFSVLSHSLDILSIASGE